ncbi:TonB-dependent receptor [Candidatus Parabeggiatoa sp. HSG14]|uniref:TonB-dependent receptor plug domain-containing protein n=1 Tax=Candidatus Parabeggiatoa sp. HSG14 TaxID=3055593 RepID=UPI0032E4FF37
MFDLFRSSLITKVIIICLLIIGVMPKGFAERFENVEIALDDTFDVFDGLVKTKKQRVSSEVEQTTFHAPPATTVITAQDIEATGAITLNEVLEMVPGLHTEYSSFLYSPIYTIRGMYSGQNPQVLMLLNGVPITSLIYGNRGLVWTGMSVNAIDRVEVIRGQGSVVYSAEAFAGVVNVITKNGKNIEGTEVSIGAGKFYMENAWILHGGNYGGFDIALATEYQATDGHKGIVDIDAQTHLDKNFDPDVSLAPGKVNVQGVSLESHLDISKANWRLHGYYQEQSNMGAGVGMADALDALGRYKNEKFNVDIVYHNKELTHNWEMMAQVNYYHTRYETKNQALFPPRSFGGAYLHGFILDTAASESHSNFNLSGVYRGLKKHQIQLGGGYHYGDLYEFEHYTNTDPMTAIPLPPEEGLINVSDTPYAWIPEMDRQNWHLFLQDTWAITTCWQLTTGIRYDEYSDFGSTLNPRIALMWQPRLDLTTQLLYGSAFRTPGFAELYSSNNPRFIGNANVKPETIDSWELVFDYQATNALHLTTNLFTYQWVDKIIYVQGASEGIFKTANVGTQKGHGLEFETRWKMTKKSSLLANYAFVKATDKNHDQDAGNYPQHSAYLRIDWLFYPKWYLDTQLNWIGERKRIFGDSRSPVDDYTTINLTLHRKEILGHWNFAVSVRNLFDTDARSPSLDSNLPNDLPLAGLNYWVELRYRF